MISSNYRHKTKGFTDSIGGMLAGIGLKANHVTMLSVVLAIVTAFAIIKGQWLAGGILILVTGAMDALDGAVARATNSSTKFGSYFDAVTDRYVEAVIFFAIGLSSGLWVLVFIAFLGSIITSYNKARAAIEVKVENANWPELLERTERILLLGIGLIAFGIYSKEIFSFTLLFWFLLALAILSNLSAIQRFFRAKKLIEKPKTKRKAKGI
ncbi:MAG: CDP-alcohol phosphatidyltransferase family protein [Candidatus Diapherotrites archaeon]